MIEVDGTLKQRLAAWLLTAVAIMGTFLLVEAYTSAERAANRAFDSQLQAASLTIGETLQWQDGWPIAEVPAAAFQILATDHQERIFYSLMNASGQVITGNLDSAMLNALPKAWEGDATWKRLWHGGEQVRLYGRELQSVGWESTGAVQIWVGHTMAGRNELARDLFLAALTRFLSMVVLTALLLGVAIRMALQPVRRLRKVLRERSADDESPLQARVPGELRELVETLNALFERQRQGRNALLRFTADASHQLKTPLAGLQSTSELALLSDSPQDWKRALQTVHQSSERTSRMAAQLLSLARLRHGSGDTHTRLNLTELLRNTVMEWAEREVAQTHDLGLAELPADDVWITGEPWSLSEMMGNLIDNALRYTPAGCVITLGLTQSDGAVTLFIQDEGSGVDEALLERLHQPFERAGRQDTEGSGLGLAIVHSIAQAHGAIFRVQNEPDGGLRVEIRFAKV